MFIVILFKNNNDYTKGAKVRSAKLNVIVNSFGFIAVNKTVIINLKKFQESSQKYVLHDKRSVTPNLTYKNKNMC